MLILTSGLRHTGEDCLRKQPFTRTRELLGGSSHVSLLPLAKKKLTNNLLFVAVLRIAANYCFHGSSLLKAVTETQV